MRAAAVLAATIIVLGLYLGLAAALSFGTDGIAIGTLVIAVTGSATIVAVSPTAAAASSLSA